jgi:hypothetical protein
MTYVLVFDAAQKPFQWLWPTLPLLLVAAGVVLFISRAIARPLAVLWIAFTGILSAWGLGGSYAEYRRAQNAIERDEALSVEGPVENFQPVRPDGKGKESFTVEGVPFEYADYEATSPGFTETAHYGGPIRPGEMVRIRYVPKGSSEYVVRSNLIVRLEIQR